MSGNRTIAADNAQSEEGRGKNLLIIPCSCELYLSRLARLAARQLAGQPGNDCHPVAEGDDLAELTQRILRAERAIVVDGCEKRCVSRRFDADGLACEFSLTLIQLGLEELGDVSPCAEDVELVVDGILAASTRVSPIVPLFPGCCC